MSGNSEYLAVKMADWLRGTDMPTAPTTLYLGLATSAVIGLTAPAEPAGGSYAREVIAFTVPAFTDNDGAQTSSTADIVFTTATADWGVITHGFISDALSGGNVLEKWVWPVSKQVDTNDTYVAATGDVLLAF